MLCVVESFRVVGLSSLRFLYMLRVSSRVNGRRSVVRLVVWTHVFLWVVVVESYLVFV